METCGAVAENAEKIQPKIKMSINLREHESGLPKIIMALVEKCGTPEEVDKARKWLHNPDTMNPKTFTIIEALFEAAVDHSNCKIIIEEIGKIEIPFLPIITKLIIKIADENEKEKIAGQYLNDLLENAKYKDDLLLYYNKWKKAKEETINRLREIADGMDETKWNVHISEVTGKSVAIMGAAVAISSVFTCGTSAAVLGIGGILTALGGGITSSGAVIAGDVLSKNAVENSNQMLKKQHETTGCLINELAKYKEKNKSYLQTARMFGEVTLRFQKVNEDSERVKVTMGIGDNIEKEVGYMRSTLQDLHKLAKSGKITEKKPDFWLKLLFGSSVANKALGFTEDAFCVISAGTKFLGVTLGAIVMMVDIATIVKTSIEISKGSKDKAAKLIREAADELKRRDSLELDDLIIAAQVEAADDFKNEEAII